MLIVNKFLRKKYLKGTTIRNMQVDRIPKVTSVWNLCRVGINYFFQQMYHILGNGIKTQLWTDNIKVLPLLENSVPSDLRI